MGTFSLSTHRAWLLGHNAGQICAANVCSNGAPPKSLAAPARETRRRQQQPPRLLAHREFAALDLARQVGEELREQFADRERRHAPRITGREQPAPVGITQLAAVAEQRREPRPHLPPLRARTAPTLRRLATRRAAPPPAPP